MAWGETLELRGEGKMDHGRLAPVARLAGVVRRQDVEVPVLIEGDFGGVLG